MRASFIETSGFTEWLTRHVADETYAALQLELMANPEKGDVMPHKPPRKPLFDRLKAGLEEGIAYSAGTLNLRTVDVPESPGDVDARTLLALRRSVGMSQTLFARMLNVSAKTVQSWEQGTRTPSHAALRLIEVLRKRPDVVLDVVGLTPPPPPRRKAGSR